MDMGCRGRTTSSIGRRGLVVETAWRVRDYIGGTLGDADDRPARALRRGGLHVWVGSEGLIRDEAGVELAAQVRGVRASNV